MKQHNNPSVSGVKWNANIVLTKCQSGTLSPCSHTALFADRACADRRASLSLKVKPFNGVTGLSFIDSCLIALY